MAIADKLTTIAGIKTDIRTAINNKGGSLASGSPFSAYSAAISSLPSGGGGGGGASSTDWSQIGYTGAPQSVQNAFSYAKTIYDNWDPTVTSLSRKFRDDKNLVYMPMVDTSNAFGMTGMFSGCTNLSTVPLLNTSKVTSMSDMFNGCISLTSVPQFDTSKVTSMNDMFSGCTSLSAVPLFDTSSAVYMFNMFASCSSLTTVPAFNTSACKSMKLMFSGCRFLTTVPAFNTSACTNMDNMFENCTGIKSLPALDTRQVTSMQNMFSSCVSLQRITSLDMDKCTSFSNMFGSYVGPSNARFMLLKGLGTPSGVTSYENSKMTNCYNWGVDSTDIPDARQSLIDSLLTYSFDRATAGYAACTIKLSSNSYNQLTPQELADIQAKGYNITTR